MPILALKRKENNEGKFPIKKIRRNQKEKIPSQKIRRKQKKKIPNLRVGESEKERKFPINDRKKTEEICRKVFGLDNI